MRQGFKKVSRGYMEGYDYIGYGWFIEKFSHYDLRGWMVYKLDECKFDEDGYVETPYKSVNDMVCDYFVSLKETKDWCKANAR